MRSKLKFSAPISLGAAEIDEIECWEQAHLELELAPDPDGPDGWTPSSNAMPWDAAIAAARRDRGCCNSFVASSLKAATSSDIRAAQSKMGDVW